ncbi:MAG: hypothetical protein HOE30_11895 [Deltaproteobacteria bacterium]|nr:hypothetical protein [Deltaproteobacteria bacterium]
MIKTIGIRREDKNEWERRVPLIPADVLELKEKYGITSIVQPSDIRIFTNEEYENAQARVDENLSDADVVFAVKEIPTQLLAKEKTYVFFSHTIKGQPYNMKMLKRLMELKCNLIDYERMSDNHNARLITFSLYAGIAGMIETLHAFSQKIKLQNYNSPFDTLKQAYQYNSEAQAKEEIKKMGWEISKNGIPKGLHPLTIGLSGYGNVSKGAQSILDLLPIKSITPAQLREGLNPDEMDNHFLYKTVFKEQDMVTPIEGVFGLQDYYDHPEKYKSIFNDYLPELKILLNCVYWTEQYPRIITRKNLENLAAKENNRGLQVIGDISCDINGSIEITRESTMPDNACYTYFAEKDDFENGIQKSGCTVMAIDNLPCEFPKEASSSFSLELKGFVENIVSADFKKGFQDLSLVDEIKKALILQNGSLTPDYRYIADFL